MHYFEYGDKEMEHLKNADPNMKLLIEYSGFIKRETFPDVFEMMIRNIVAQQISSKAAETVFLRLKDLAKINAPNIIKLGKEKIQSCGMSVRKAGYIVNIANKVQNNEVDFKKLCMLDDNELTKELCKLDGVGIWSAEMLMIFALKRMDILSYGDFAIRKGLMRLHSLSEISKEQFNQYKKGYSPYGSVASIYIWHIAAMENYEDIFKQK